jgi:Ser/Thr protein kinase RdoA (MazF antagonist)
MPRPTFDLSDAKRLALELFNVESSAVSMLDSYDDQNFLVKIASDAQYVLKISNTDFDTDCLEMQNAAMLLLHEKGLPVPCPIACTSSDCFDGPVYISKCTGVRPSFCCKACLSNTHTNCRQNRLPV